MKNKLTKKEGEILIFNTIKKIPDKNKYKILKQKTENKCHQ